MTIPLNIPEYIDCGDYVLDKINIKYAQQRHEGYVEAKNILKNIFEWARDDYSYEDELAYIKYSLLQTKAEKAFDYCIIDKVSGEYIGTMGILIKSAEWGIAELAYWIKPSWFKKGVVSKCMDVLTKKLINECNFYRLYLDVIPLDNIPSCKIAEKSGFEFYGKTYHSQFLNGESTDALRFVKLKAQDKQKELENNAPKLKKIYNIEKW